MNPLGECLRRLLNPEGSIYLEDMRCVMRACSATDAEKNELDEEIDKAVGSLLINRMLEHAFLKSEEGKSEGFPDSALAEGQITLRTLVNMANRIPGLKESINSSVLHRLHHLILVAPYLLEVVAVLTTFAVPMHKACALDSHYDVLVSATCMLWQTVESDNTRAWIAAFISSLLDVDGAFLASAFADFRPHVFSALLEIVLALCERDAECTIHPNNIHFCVVLIERILYDFGAADAAPKAEDAKDAARRDAYVGQLPLLIEIIAECALHKSTFATELHEKTSAIECIVWILETTLSAEGALLAAIPPVPRAHDRPAPPGVFRSARVANTPNLRNLETALREQKQCVPMVKKAAVRAIGNLVSDSGANRAAAGANGAVLLVLMCCRRVDEDEPFLMQWAIATLRYLCLGCPENQEILANIDSTPSGVIDRSKLLTQLGLRPELDPETKKIKLVPL